MSTRVVVATGVVLVVVVVDVMDVDVVNGTDLDVDVDVIVAVDDVVVVEVEVKVVVHRVAEEHRPLTKKRTFRNPKNAGRPTKNLSMGIATSFS